MKIKDLHPDIERYLTHDCYCPNEVYDSSGFFYRIFKPEDECEKLIENEKIVVCLSKNQMIVFWKDGDGVIDAQRYDSTENNVKGVLNWVKTKEKFNEDKFDESGYKKTIQELLNISDFVIRD